MNTKVLMLGGNRLGKRFIRLGVLGVFMVIASGACWARSPDYRLKLVPPVSMLEPGSLDFELSRWALETNDTGAVRIHVGDARGLVPPGVPDVPVISRIVEIPEGFHLQVEILSSTQEVLSVAAIAIKPVPEELVTSMAKESPYPSECIQVDHARQRGRNIARIALYPVQAFTTPAEFHVQRSWKAVLRLLPIEQISSMQVLLPSTESLDSLLTNQPVCVLDAGPLLPESNGNAEDYALRRAGPSVAAAWKFSIHQPGVYRIDHAAMLASGMDTNDLVGTDFRLFWRSNEVALAVSTEGVFGDGDWIEFFGLGYDGYYSTNSVYWLGFGEGGLRRESVSCAPLNIGMPVTSYVERVVRDEAVQYASGYEPTRDVDHWFVDLATESSTKSFAFATPDRIPGLTAALQYSLHEVVAGGTSLQLNSTDLLMGSTVLTNLSAVGQAWVTGVVSFSSSELSDGSSLISVDQLPAPSVPSGCYIESLVLDFPRVLRSTVDELCFALPPGNSDVWVDGFSTQDVRVLDISDFWNPVECTDGFVTNTVEGFRLSFQQSRSEAKNYMAYTAPSIRSIPSLEPVMFRDLASTNRSADYIVICPYTFREQVYRLLKQRDLEGLRVAVAPVEDIYNEFGYGMKHSEAIQQFIGYAYHHWQSPAHRYVLLVGKGTADPLDIRGFGVEDWIPVPMGPTIFRWTARDNEYAMVDSMGIGNDPLADVAIGRMPVNNTDELEAVVDKIISFEATLPASPWKNTLLAVADAPEAGLAFHQDSDDNIITNALAGGFDSLFDVVTQYYLPANSVGTNSLTAFINSGFHWITYVGHGSLTDWTDKPIWTVGNVAGLNNTAYPVIGIFSCQNGAYQDPALGDPCLAEAFLVAEGKGASAVVAPSALSNQDSAMEIADGYSRALMDEKQTRLGDGVLEGLLQLWGAFSAADELYVYEVFGDPAMKVNP